jgi:hypothetical protein
LKRHFINTITFSLIVVLTTINLIAQPVGGIGEYYTNKQVKTGINGFYNINSTAFTNQIYKQIAYGGYIDNSTKERIEKRLTGKNYIGADLNTGLYFSIRKQDSLKKNPLFFGAIRNVEHLDFTFNDDLFTLAMFGNTRFKGDTANFGSLRGQLLRYQKIEGGFFTSNKKFGLALAYLKGEQLINVEIPNATLYTSADATRLELDINGFWQISDTTNKKLMSFNGHGASLSLFYKYTFKEDESRFINIEINDLGIIRWNKKSITRSFDTTFIFEGVTINNLLNFDESNIGNNNEDSLINRFSKSKNSGVSTFIPLSFHLAYFHKLNEKFTLINGVIYRISAQYIPFLYLQPQYKLNEYLKIIARAAYGGYGKFHFATGINGKIKDKWHIGFTVDNIEGFISPKNTGGNGMSIRLAKEF